MGKAVVRLGIDVPTFTPLFLLHVQDKDSLNILVLGKGAVGKSSTVNSIVGERVATVTPFQGEIMRPEVVFRQKAGFTLSIFDTPAIEDGGSVNEDLLKGMRGFLLEKPIDALLYVDRLDTYRVDELDREVRNRLLSVVLVGYMCTWDARVAFMNFVRILSLLWQKLLFRQLQIQS